jgi:CheY-like chemotaxis protein
MDGTKRPCALVSDVKLAGRLTGWEVARRIRGKESSFPIVYITAYDRDWPAFGVTASLFRSHLRQWQLEGSMAYRAIKWQSPCGTKMAS